MGETFGEGPKEPTNGEGLVIDFESFKKSREKKDLTPGSEFTIPDFGSAANFGYGTNLPWVKIVRGTTGHGEVETGVIEKGNKVVVKGVSKEFGVLCGYKASNDSKGTELKDGALFFIDPTELLFWPKLTELERKKEERLKEEIKRILGEE